MNSSPFLYTHSSFTWTDPVTHQPQQFTWTVLPKGFLDSSHFFRQALTSNLAKLDLHPSTLLQYVVDRLLCSPSYSLSYDHTASLLNYLTKNRYQVSLQKAQLSSPQVIYLGVSITPQCHTVALDRKDLILSLLPPALKEELLSFLSLASFLHIWVPNFSILACPLFLASIRSID